VKCRGFSLIELSTAVAIIVVALGLVILQYDFGSLRQRASAAARLLSLDIQKYRELSRDCCHAWRFDADGSGYKVFSLHEKTVEKLAEMQPIHTVKFPAPCRMAALKVNAQSQPLGVLLFDSSQIMPETEIELRWSQRGAFTLRIHPVVNEVSLNEIE
jgi:prepilin-type N-terminal cleavage/methylation domain-containing protein